MLFFNTWNSSQQTIFVVSILSSIYFQFIKRKRKNFYISLHLFSGPLISRAFFFIHHFCVIIQQAWNGKGVWNLQQTTSEFSFLFSLACIFFIIGLVLISYDSKAKIYNLVPFLQLIENEKHKNP